MRLWSLHPKYLDSKGLVALWREALLAQKVLVGDTTRFRNHPQLVRFQEHDQPEAAIASYLAVVHSESKLRAYRFNASKIGSGRIKDQIPVAQGQIKYEWERLLSKLRERDPDRFKELRIINGPMLHPIFTQITGGIHDWERG